MSARTVAISSLGAILLLSAIAQAAFTVQPDKENVVSNRIMGAWRVDGAATERLGGGKSSGLDSVSFRADSRVAERIPEKYGKFLDGRRIYAAGRLTLKGKDHPFILIVHAGNPHVVWFRERDGDPMGDAESFNVMLAAGRDASTDMLFIGQDIGISPFAVYRRAAHTAQKLVPQTRAVDAWIRSVKRGNLGAYKVAHSERMRKMYEKSGWEKGLKAHQAAFQKAFGDYTLGDFKYTFEGNAQRGRVKVSFRGTPMANMTLVNEKGRWRIDEK